MDVSAVLIAKDEAATLARCLGSLRGVVDEIIVADTGSTDETPQLAERLGAQVVRFPWTQDFSAARNHALSQASGAVVLSIDADEYLVTPADAARAQFEAFMESGPHTLGLVEILNERLPGAEEEPALDRTARVFRRDAFCFEGAVHEQLVPLPSDAIPGSRLLSLRLHHTGYALSPAAAAAKAQRNIAILRKELAAHPDDEYFHYQLAKAWQSLGRHKLAAVAFQRALRCMDFSTTPPMGRLGPVGRPVLTGATCGAAYALINAGALADAVALLEQHRALAHHGTQSADFFHALGYAWLQSGRLDEANAAYRLALGLPEDVIGTGSHAAWYHLGLIDEAQGRHTAAQEKYQRALETNAAYAPAVRRIHGDSAHA